MGAKTNECGTPSLANKAIFAVCTTVVAVLIIWLCSSAVDSGVRLSIIETSYKHIQGDLGELKQSNVAIKDLLSKIRLTQKAIEAKIP